jgi:hypothetical protein
MAQGYFFFRPARLPLAPDDLSADTVLPLTDAPALQAALSRELPMLSWDGPEGRGEWEGHWLEFRLPGAGMTLSLRCSLRADYTALVQQLCDGLGWLAFDETPLLFQPHRPPQPA